ncbi:hypothetical protein SD70_14220 [Gordoniibacillus kamchatkensis]|uniref:Uncharacterized protein n=1 Tax=Gordoniibacillus kamchatkensis TaxID=1590651 RepID=A0ABR5AH52_9BACL|nr:hypothetical protein [Paenibacillus sp. VKM B-2647]KIL40381.1 hypothetical protein SD70_14220 [Paenibacillus sp. VKM B-2647]
MSLSNLVPKIRTTTNSLFIRLFASFLIVIVILVSFTYFSLSYSKNKVRDEVIRYNTLNLKATTDSYEKEFELVKNLLLNLYFNENVQLMYADGRSVNYEIADKTVKDIRQITTNPRLYLNNVIIYYKKASLVLDASSFTQDSIFFNKFYSSKEYPLAFWQGQFQSDEHFRVYAPSNFYDIPFVNDYNLLGRAFPVVVKNNWAPDFYMAAFLDVKKNVPGVPPVHQRQFFHTGRGRPRAVRLLRGRHPRDAAGLRQREGVRQEGQQLLFLP